MNQSDEKIRVPYEFAVKTRVVVCENHERYTPMRFLKKYIHIMVLCVFRTKYVQKRVHNIIIPACTGYTRRRRTVGEEKKNSRLTRCNATSRRLVTKTDRCYFPVSGPGRGAPRENDRRVRLCTYIILLYTRTRRYNNGPRAVVRRRRVHCAPGIPATVIKFEFLWCRRRAKNPPSYTSTTGTRTRTHTRTRLRYCIRTL